VNIPALENILIVRTDRIGDVVLSLPMIDALNASYPSARIGFLLRSYTRELVSGRDGLNLVLLYDDDRGVEKPFMAMLTELKRHRFDAVVVTYPTFRLALLMYLAGIPVRVGTGYRWYSLLFNRRVYEHRKTAEKHEAQYNLSLLTAIGCEPATNVKPVLEAGGDAVRAAATVLDEHGLEAGRFVILHPGSGGSARDWKPANFGALAAGLHETGISVLVTGGPGEEGLLAQVRANSNGTATILRRPLSLKVLAALIKSAAVFVSNSTGPLHIAAAVGTPVVAFYPPIRQCSSARWGPLTDQKVIFEPRAGDCPRCKGGPCQSDVCMESIRVEDVQRAVLSLMRSSTSVARVP
jgi:heptosyltransferase-2